MHLVPYSIEEFERTLTMDDFRTNYLDAQTCSVACAACDKFGKNWPCPPFDFGAEALLKSYATMDVICSKATLMRSAIDPVPADKCPVYVNDTYALIKLVVEDKLLAREKREPGSVALFPGSCMRCPHGCKRAEGQPCVSPNTMRYSLEAFGGMLGPLVKDLFDEEFCWSGPDELPEYFLLVSAILKDEI